MKILALDSTAVVASVAVCDGEKLLACYTVNAGNTHSETLLPMVESALKATDLTVDDIELFALSEGPGSFTGVRIGAATVKGLAFGREKPCVGVSTLEALAYNLCGFEGILCPCMNARRNQVYNALLRAEKGILTRISEDRAIALADLKTELESIDGPIYLVGDGADLTSKMLYDLNLILPAEWRQHQRAVGVGLAALASIARGETGDAATLAPNYLRLSQAERERLEKENKKS